MRKLAVSRSSMKTRELKPNERYDTEPKKYEKSKIYKITRNVDILVYEEQPKNNTKDYVMLHYQFNEGEVGYFSETLWTRAQKADRETGC